MKPTEWAFMAGLFDAEGCITGGFNTKSQYPYLRVSITNTDRKMISWLKTTFGGNVVTIRTTKTSFKARRQRWDWVLRSKEIKPFLKGIIPHLRLKRRQAYAALAFLACEVRGKRKSLRTSLVKKMHFHNQNPVPDYSQMKQVNAPGKAAHAYLAGFLEGDGCIGVYQSRTGPYGVLIVYNTRKDLLDWFLRLFGGVVVDNGRAALSKRNIFYWRTRKDEQLRLLPKLIPFLRWKKIRAERVLSLYA